MSHLSGAEERLGASASVFHRAAEANRRAASCWSALGFRLASLPSVVDQSGDLSGRTDVIGWPSASSNQQSVDLDRQTAAADEASSYCNSGILDADEESLNADQESADRDCQSDDFAEPSDDVDRPRPHSVH